MKETQKNHLKEPVLQGYDLVLYKKIRSAGRSNPIKAETLAKELEVSIRGLRDDIHYLITKYRIPILGSRQEPYGYWIAENEGDLQNGILALENQHKSIGERLDVFKDCDFSVLKKYDYLTLE